MNNNRNMIINIAYIVISMILLICTKIGLLGDIYTGVGVGLLVVGALQLIKVYRYSRNKEYQEKVDIEISDERNKYLRMKAWSWAGYMFVIIMAVSTIICMILGKEDIMMYCSSCVCLVLVLFWGSYAYIKNKY